MFQESLMTDAEAEKLLEGVFRTLSNVGMMIQNQTSLAALEKAGAQVDYAEERARLPRPMVQVTVDHLRQQGPPGGYEPPNQIEPPGLPGLGCQVAQLYLDWESKERRAGTRDDFIKMVKLGDVLHEGQRVGHCLLLRDLPAPIEPLEACAVLIEQARTPGYTYPHYADQFDYLMELGEIYCGRKDRFLVGGIFITSPLRICRRAADFMVKRLEIGLDCSCGTMACVGASVPVTLPGAIVVAAAEILGTWVAIRTLRPDAELSASIAAGSVDMRSGNTTYCSPEAMLLDFGTAEFFRRACGIRIGVAGASDYSNAKFPGLAAAWEKAFKSMTVSAFTGRQPPVGDGLLESGKTLSPEQLLIERDVTRHVQQLAKPFDMTEDAIALDAIEEVGFGLEQNYLNCEHTLNNFRSSLWHPTMIERSVWKGFHGSADEDRELVNKAHEAVEEMVAQYTPPEVDSEKLVAIRQVVEKARERLC